MSANAGERSTFYFAVPGDLASPTGGYAYARALLGHAEAVGIELVLVPLPAGYPTPTPNDIAETERQFAKLPATATVLVDGLAYGAMPEQLVAGLPQKLVALVHHPLALETGITAETATRLERRERKALAHADAVIITGAETANILHETYCVAPERITLAEPGVAERARAITDPSEIPRLLSIGAVSPRKGYDTLVDALTRLHQSPWTLDIVGDITRDETTSLKLAEQIYRTRQGDRIALHGAVPDDALDRLFRTSHLFVLPSRFEGYGMVLTEAVAYGLPIVATETTPSLKTIPPDACIGVPVDHPEALAAAIRSVLEDPERLAAMSDAAWAFANQLPRWTTTTETVARLLKEVA